MHEIASFIRLAEIFFDFGCKTCKTLNRMVEFAAGASSKSATGRIELPVEGG